MPRSNLFVACLFALFAGNAIAQNFPSKPLTLICPFAPASALDEYLRAFARIASKYLGQEVMVEIKTGGTNTRGPVTMAATAQPDGYTLSQLPIEAFRVPHMQRVTWNPVKDFTYIIGLAGITVGVVVKSDSQFKSLKDLIDFAKANPGRLSYSGSSYGQTGHLVMEELGVKAGARFLRVPTGDYPGAAEALIPGGTRRRPENLGSIFSRTRRSALSGQKGWTQE